MYYYLYKITNLLNGKIYVGVHKTSNLDDGYMGSGKVIKQAIEKYGRDNFKKEILEFFNDSDSMFEREIEYVNDNFLMEETTYNLRRGGNGGFDYINKNKINHTYEAKEKRRTTFMKTLANKDLCGENSSFYGKTHTDESKKKISDSRKVFFENGGEHPKGMQDKKHSEKTKKQVSEKMKQSSSLIGKSGNDHPCGGTKWYNNGTKHIRSNVHPGDGWVEGRIFKERKKRK